MTEKSTTKKKGKILLRFYFNSLQNGTEYNTTAEVLLDDLADFDGECNDNFNTLSVEFRKDWQLFFNYTLKQGRFALDTIKLQYTLDPVTFPEAVNASSKVTAIVTGRQEFAANKGNSYKCYSKTSICLNEVQLIFRDYQAQPFEDGKTSGFDTGKKLINKIKTTCNLYKLVFFF